MRNFTVVYMDANKKPKDTRKTVVQANGPHQALVTFINLPQYRGELFVACIVAAQPRAVYHTQPLDLPNIMPTLPERASAAV